MANLEDLPDEMIVKILDYLNYDELLTIRNMNIKLSDLVDYVIGLNEIWLRFHKMHQLIPRIIKSGISHESIHLDKCLISNSSLNFLNNQDAYQKIKKLILFDLNILPEKINFSDLIQLEIRQLGIVNNSKLIINAPNLEILFIDLNSIKDDNFKITFDAIKLKFFKSSTHNLDRFSFVYPNSIENIYCFKLNHFDDLNKIKSSINLKELICWSFQYANLNVFKNFIHLNKLHFYYSNVSLIDLFNRLNLINNNLAIYLNGVQLNSIDNFEDLKNIKQLNKFTESELKIYENYIHLLDNLNVFSELNMQNLDDLPLEIINKLNNITTLYINNNMNENDKLIEILKTCKPIKIIINVQLDQRILNIISQFNCLNIQYLKIIELNDINFIRNMKHLQELKCDNFLDFNLLKFIVKNLKYLELIEMKTKFKIKLTYDQIQFIKDDQIIIQELKNVFINHTIYSINFWSELFVDFDS